MASLGYEINFTIYQYLIITNLCILSFAEKNCSSLIPDHKFNDEDLEILNPLNNLDKIRLFIDNQDINQYMSFIVDRLFSANKYFIMHLVIS